MSDKQGSESCPGGRNEALRAEWALEEHTTAQRALVPLSSFTAKAESAEV